MNAKIIADTLRKAADRSPSIFASLIDRYLRQAKKGCLKIEDRQNRRVYEFGQGDELKALIRVNDPVFFRKLALATDIGLGESYVDGDWDTDSITKVIQWFILNVKDMPSMSGGKASRHLLLNSMSAFQRVQHLFNQNTVEGSKRNISNHYDLGNEFFAGIRLYLDE